MSRKGQVSVSARVRVPHADNTVLIATFETESNVLQQKHWSHFFVPHQMSRLKRNCFLSTSHPTTVGEINKATPRGSLVKQRSRDSD